MTTSRHNHYVPKWYQKRFLPSGASSFCYLNLYPEKSTLPDGRIIELNDSHHWGANKCFREKDLYTTILFGVPNDEIERYLFGDIDNRGAKAVQALVNNDFQKLYHLFTSFFEYMDAQEIRTPKGLDYIKTKYPQLTKAQLMYEMQCIRKMHCTMWVEAVREIVSAEDSDVKFIITDHPVTIYNPACPPESISCKYPNDPSIALKGSQTIFPLGLNHCLILTNLEYARDPFRSDLLTNRTNARYFGQTIARFDTMIRVRKLKPEDVNVVNHIMKSRARKYISAANKQWLYPERNVRGSWAEIGKVLLPPKDEIWHFGGEIYVGYENGSTYYQDAFGRTVGELPFLKKPPVKGKIGPNDPCPCGSGKKYKKCCRDKPLPERPSSSEYSIRERNLMFINALIDILGLNKGKTWEDIRRELSDKQVVDIHNAFGCLWPKDTNLIDLLPKSDPNIIRAIFMGLIDPRITPRNVIGLTPYVDEIILLNPFINPACINPEFSPTHSPGQYKQETVKNALLLMQLMPFIDAGIINLIPDPCDFNPPLRKQIYDMAKDRLGNSKPSKEQMESMINLYKDDVKRSMMALPDENLKRLIKNALPELSDKELESALDYMKAQSIEDPLALLQPLPPGEKGAQLYITHLTPNIELCLFLSQITGSFIYTDNQFRWAEIISLIDSKYSKSQVSPWEPLAKFIASIDFTYEINPFLNCKIRQKEESSALRKVMRKICMSIRSNYEYAHIESVAKSLSEELKEAYIKMQSCLCSIQKEMELQPETTFNIQSYQIKGKINCRIPLAGLTLNTVQRLLLSYGGSSYSKSIPMAMYIETNAGQ